MGQQSYVNLIVIGVQQSDLVAYLSSLNCKSYVSPTINGRTVLYPAGLEIASAQVENILEELAFMHQVSLADAQPELRETYKKHLDAELEKVRISLQGYFDLSVLGPGTKETLQQYEGLPEGSLICWARHLSAHFSCPVLAIHSRDEFHFWYYLSSNGAMLDEYTTAADETWLPGQPLFSEVGHDIRGGDAIALCNAFDKPACIENVRAILYDSEIVTTRQYTHQPEYETLAKEGEFSASELRHWLLATVLGISPWWTVGMSDETIASETWLDYFSDLEHSSIPSQDLAKQQLKSILPPSEAEDQQSTQIDEQLAIDHIRKRRKEKNFSIPYSLQEIFDELERNLAKLSEYDVFDHDEVKTAVRELTAPALKPEPFSLPGKYGIVEHLITVVEALLCPEDPEMKAIAQSAMVELDKRFRRKLLAPVGQLWTKKHKVLLEEALGL